MAINTYDIGDVVRMLSTFTQNAVALDPSTVALTVKDPAGTSTTYTYAGATVTKDSVGNYHVDIEPTITGTYKYRWFSSGTGKAAEENSFQVRTRKVL